MADESVQVRAESVQVRAEVERKGPSLPRFVVLPESAVASWNLTGTTTVELTLGGVDVGRRSLKHWPERSGWFIDLTDDQAVEAGVETGDRVTLEIRRASAVLPDELRELLDADEGARTAWSELTVARRRMIAEHVRAAKRAETRARRARRSLGRPA